MLPITYRLYVQSSRFSTLINRLPLVENETRPNKIIVVPLLPLSGPRVTSDKTAVSSSSDISGQPL